MPHQLHPHPFTHTGTRQIGVGAMAERVEVGVPALSITVWHFRRFQVTLKMPHAVHHPEYRRVWFQLSGPYGLERGYNIPVQRDDRLLAVLAHRCTDDNMRNGVIKMNVFPNEGFKFATPHPRKPGCQVHGGTPVGDAQQFAHFILREGPPRPDLKTVGLNLLDHEQWINAQHPPLA